MKYRYLIFVSLLSLGLYSCQTPPKPLVYNVQVHTMDNQQINLCNFKVYDKEFYVESDSFRARWRQSLELVNLPFDNIISAQKIGRFITRVRFKDGSEDDFTEFFVDSYNLKGWSEYGSFDINATLVRGLVFVDKDGNPLGGEEDARIPPIINAPDIEDRFITFDGDIISGELQARKFKIRTAYGTLILAGDLIGEIIVDREAEVLQQVVKMKNGDIISGFMEPPQVKMIISDDQVITLDVDQLSRIRFGRPVTHEEDEER